MAVITESPSSSMISWLARDEQMLILIFTGKERNAVAQL
jgi:hypothetical protein